ncbi:MAG TPA: STAS domain-containing protein [Nocardioidaceae bacterium]|nr:STAS domain-containing protein [Nocardioidaceae bacterium]
MAQFQESQRPDGTSVLGVEGEVDVAVVDELIGRMRDSLDRGQALELDCSGLTFIDSSGLGGLVLVSKEAAAQGKAFGLVNVHSTALRLLQVSGLYDTLVKQDPQT